MIVSYNGTMTSPDLPRPLGRPREFDLDAAVDDAVLVFRERGYQAASVGDLCAATGLTAGSLYKAFGDKRSLFITALDRYLATRHARLKPLLDEQPNGRERIGALLRFYAESSWGEEGRRGCLVVSAAMALATFDDELAARVSAAMHRTEDLLRRLLRQGQDDGSIDAGLPVPATARSLLALLHGLRTVGKPGRSRHEMLGAAQEALRLVPRPSLTSTPDSP